jgi:hypothetical protein
MKRIDIAGQRFGRLVALSYRMDQNNRAVWTLICDCGKKIERPLSYIRNGGTRSCGCLRKDQGQLRRKPHGEASANSLYSKCKCSASERNLSFNLSSSCHYCGTLPIKTHGGKLYNGAYLHNGIDRVNNNIGYELSNCVPCCMICNRAKNTLSVGDFLAWMFRFARYQHV